MLRNCQQLPISRDLNNHPFLNENLCFNRPIKLVEAVKIPYLIQDL